MNQITRLENGRTSAVSQATAVEQSRAIAEVQAAVVVAQNHPRDKSAAMAEMREVCRIPSFAERAFFSFSRGGSAVKGETVHLARELARCWGNIACGIVELSRDEFRGQSEMMAFAWDLQTNDRQQTTFIVPHSRDTKQGKKAITDDRDVYENNANMGARRLREMIFAVLPIWFRDEAAELCRETLADGGGKPLVQRIADCVKHFAEIGIGRNELEKHTGRKLDDLTPEDVASLGVVYKSIKRGDITKDEAFPRDTPEDGKETVKPTGSKLDAFEATLKPADKSAETLVTSETVDAETGEVFPGDTPTKADAPKKTAA